MAGAITWNYDKYGSPPTENNAIVQKLESFNKAQAEAFDSMGKLADKFLHAFDWVKENWQVSLIGAIAVLLLVRRI